MSDDDAAKLVSQFKRGEPSLASTVFRRMGGAQPKPEPEPPKDAVVRQRPSVRSWSEVVVPKSANELETLTYVPGLVGDIVEWIVSGARCRATIKVRQQRQSG
jgi:hypothetical protein